MENQVGHPVDLYHIPPGDRASYTDIDTTMNFIEAKYETFITGGSQYIAVTHVSEFEFEQFDRKREFLGLHSIAIRFFTENEVMIVKFRHHLHFTTGDIILGELLHKFHELGINTMMLRPLGLGMQVLPGGLKIEPDKSFLPRPTRNIDGYSSFVVEIGNMDSLNNLQTDARLWLDRTSNGRSTKVVLVLAISEGTQEMVFEKWEYGNYSECVQRISVRCGRTELVIGAPLTLPLRLIFDEVPVLPGISSSESDVLFSGRDLGVLTRTVLT